MQVFVVFFYRSPAGAPSLFGASPIGRGVDLSDNLGNLVDLPFPDDILLFANSGPEVLHIFSNS